MSPCVVTDPALSIAFLEAAETRAVTARRSAGWRPGAGLGLGPIRQSAADVPALIELARSGLLARKLIEQHGGWARRLEHLREMHGPEDRGGGLIVCLECSRPFERVLWPCPTMQVLDGMPAP